MLDNSEYSKESNLGDWKKATSAVPGSDLQKWKELNRPIAAAKALSDNWQKWGLSDDLRLSDPLPEGAPPEAKSVIDYLRNNPAVGAALDTAGSGGGKVDGIIQRHDVKAFADAATSQMKDAGNTVSDWLNNNKQADPQSKALVQSAGLIMANQSLAMGAGPKFQKGEYNDQGLVRNLGLLALKDNPGLSAALGDAGKLWTQNGMLGMIDSGGDDLAVTEGDQAADAGNIKAWITNGAPRNSVDFANTMNQAAIESCVAGIDTSKLGPGVFEHPENFSGADKAAVLVQLSNLQTKYAIGAKEGYWGAGQSQSSLQQNGINPNFTAVQKGLDQHIKQLAADPQVQRFLSQTKPKQLQNLANADGSVHDAMQNFFNDKINTGDALANGMEAKDDKGNPVPPSQVLQTFLTQAGVYDAALGQNGKTMGLMGDGKGSANGSTKLQEIVQKSGQEGKLETYFNDNILNAKLLNDAVSKGTDLTAALSQYTSAAAAFGTALDPDFINKNTAKLQQNYTTAMMDNMFTGDKKDSLESVLGDPKKDGHLDEAKAKDILDKARKTDPDLFKTSDGTDLTTDQVITFVKSTYDAARGGLGMQEALKQTSDDLQSRPEWKAHASGMLHVVSAVLGGGVLAAQAAKGANTPIADATLAASAASMVGTFTDSVAKWRSNNQTLSLGGDKPPPPVSDAVKSMGGAGRLLGGLGGALGGALGIVSGIQSLNQGDVPAAVLNIGTGAAGIGGGIVGATEGGAALLEGAGLLPAGISDGLAVGSAALGLGSAVVGSVGALGYAVYEIVKSGKNDSDYISQVLPVLQQYGITGGPEDPSKDDKPDTVPQQINHHW